MYTYFYVSIYDVYTYFYMCNYSYSNMCIYNRLHLIKICLCCFLDMHLYSNNLSTIATISSLFISELLPACFSCNNNFNLSQSSLGSEDRFIVLDIPEAMSAGDSKFFYTRSMSSTRSACAFGVIVHFFCKLIN